MNDALSVSTCIYKLFQNPETYELTFYVYNEPVKVENSNKKHSWQELYTIMCAYAYEYQREREEDNNE